MKFQQILFRLFLVSLSIFVLILIRKYQSQIFYDPFLEYFANDNVAKAWPNYNSFQMYASLILRWLLNAIFSLLLLTALFWKKKVIISALQIYTVFGLVSLLLYMLQIEYELPLGEKMAFFTRRLLIQPFLVLILIPTYYYQIKTKK